MIEEYLINYGVLGVWTITLLWDKLKSQEKTNKVIENNTRALYEFKTTISKCKRAQ